MKLIYIVLFSAICLGLGKFTTLNDALLFNPISLYVPECVE